MRRAFADGAARDRETALHDLASALGYQRLGSRIREVLSDHIRTAVRRGILQNERGQISIGCHTIKDYGRPFLKEQFISSLGRSWIERPDAVRNFAHWLGYQRTSPALDEIARSLINGLIREFRIEASGSLIRRI